MLADTAPMATLVFTPEAREQYAKVPPAMLHRMYNLTERLKKWPEVSGAKPLSGNLAGHYRLRTGDYRLQFRVEGERVIVEKIGHRDRFYD